jgi:transposase-like protein
MALDVAQLIATFYQNKYPGVSRFLEEGLEGTLTFFDYPDIHQRKIRTTNLIEGVLNKAFNTPPLFTKSSKVPDLYQTICDIIILINSSFLKFN